MKCRELKTRLSFNLDDLQLTPDEKEHIASCAECRRYLQQLQTLQSGLQPFDSAPMTAGELAILNDRLDSAITRYLNRATGLYRFAVRYATMMTAVILVVAISFMPAWLPNQSADRDVEYLSTTSGYEAATTAGESLDSAYVDIAVYDFLQHHRYNSGELLLGELSAEELEYIDENITLGGIL